VKIGTIIYSTKQCGKMETRPKILVVDDDELSQDFLRYFLIKKYDVYTCGTVNAFYNLIQKVDFDLILMDIFLRDTKDGFQLTTELKQNARYKNIPILIVTAQNTTKDRRASEDIGAEMFITKPLDTKFVLNCISTILSKNT
jgi:DNA-binding response OmpR family regulator